MLTGRDTGHEEGDADRRQRRFWKEFPLCPIRVFDTESERKSELDRIFEGGDGKNLIRVSRKQVVAWFGASFAINERGEVCKEWGEYE